MIRSFGERSLLVEVTGWEAAQALAASLRDDPPPGVEAAVPALQSVLVELLAADAAVAEGVAREIDRRLERATAAPAGHLHVIRVRYGGEDGPDLDEVAEERGLTPDEYARRHAATPMRVLFCGFAPGFAYLGDLPQELRVARLATPRTQTPAGSVAVAGSMSGIYPARLPGGWRIIGRTATVMFDPYRDPPSLLAPGDTVRFEPAS